MRIFKLVAAVGLLMSTAACAVYTRDYPYAYRSGYYARPVAYAYRPAPVYYSPPVAYAYSYY